MPSNAMNTIEKLETQLWEAADQLRANSKLTSSEYCMPMLKLPTGTSLGTALVEAMNAIEAEFEPLKGQLPKEYDKFDDKLLEDILRTFDSAALRTVSGDIFGRIPSASPRSLYGAAAGCFADEQRRAACCPARL